MGGSLWGHSRILFLGYTFDACSALLEQGMRGSVSIIPSASVRIGDPARDKAM
jgi:hypothetical protein